jgi:hypothetical protein
MGSMGSSLSSLISVDLCGMAPAGTVAPSPETTFVGWPALIA